MSIELRDLIPELSNSQVEIHVHITAQPNITPFVAQQKVGGLLLSQIGTGVLPGELVLIATHRQLVWRVPVFLALPGLGRIGDLGHIDIDAQTGQVLADQALLKQLIENAKQLTPSSSS